jgi:PAT family beta-lactamase induction signal transducer AmpG
VPSDAPPASARRGLYARLAFLYGASGLPYGIATDGVPTVYKAKGVDLATIGALSLIELPWTLKFLWAPLVDRFGGRRAWAFAMQLALAGLLVGLSFLPSDGAPALGWVVLALLAVASATQDVAIDAYAVEAVPASLVGPASGVRVTAYRLALLVGGGFLVAREATLGWAATWRLAAGLFVLFAFATLRVPPVPRRERTRGPVLEPLRLLASRSGFVAVLAFVLLFKAGDYLMAKMTKPCLLDRGFTQQEIGDLVTPLGIGATILGAVVGGWFTARAGLFRALWILGLLQAVSNLGYALGAGAGKDVLWGAAVFEPFCGGLGTAPFLALLMRSCDRAHAATQFALWTAVMALGRVIAGWRSGVLAESMGYAPFFALTFAVALPAFALLPWVRRWLAAADARPAT